MTSLLRVFADGSEGVIDLAAPATTHPGASSGASEDALRLALALRASRGGPTGRALLFVPASSGLDASRLVQDAVQGLLDLQEGPLLVMDLGTGAGRAGAPLQWAGELRRDAPPDAPWTGAASYVAPLAARTDAVRYVASPEFAAQLADARSRYPYVLCVGGALTASVQTLLTASLCDGVILSVAPGRTTRADVLRVTRELQRVHAKVMGFVLDARLSPGGPK